MTNRINECPSICIDLKKSRIRIHQKTLHLLSDPDYIEILVNPSSRCFIIRKATKRKNSHCTITNRLPGGKQCFELYSREFIQEIQTVTNGLKSFRSYKITGKINSERTAAVFSLDNALPVETGKENDLYVC